VIKKSNTADSLGPLILIVGIVWTLILGAGFTKLEREEFTPVMKASVAGTFPPSSAIKLAADKSTLLLFLHPYCPCSRASLRELDEVLAETQGKLSVFVVFTIPNGLPPGWEQGDLWISAAKMPGVCIVPDPAGLESIRFGVNGSGHALLYNPSGELLFSGGITPSRGHEGDSLGRSAIVSFVLQGRAPVARAPVFGCSLL
jgi:hypothetical protein